MFKILILIIYALIFLLTIKQKNNFNNQDNNNLLFLNLNNNYTFQTLLYNKYFLYFKIIDLVYFFSFKFKNIKVEYKIVFYNKNNLILPSDITLYKNFHVLCFFENKNNNEIIFSIPNIYNNKYYRCIYFFEVNEKINFGIKIYENNAINKKVEFMIKLFYIKQFKYYNFNNHKNGMFDLFILNRKFINNAKDMNNLHINKTLKLKKSFLKYPYSIFNKNIILNNNIWYFKNLYNIYFCLCKGYNCLNKNNYQQCKYYFYLNIIDINRNIYKKTSILFIDFIFKNLSSDDSYPIFQKMINYNLSVYYLTENLDIYNDFCINKNKCQSIILVDKNNFTINGDFLEKYLTLILRLKQVITNSGTYLNYINNIFYNIEYITYITITHGVNYFKYFLYEANKCYSYKRYDKLLIPPSEKIIKMAKKYGWDDKNLITLNLPKWDKFNVTNEFYNDKEKKNNKDILLMFTWREINNNKKISKFYMKNINYIINNKILNKILNQNNIILNFALHHKVVNIFQNQIKNYKNIKYINQNEIFESLAKTYLIITDFSSIIFDIIYRKKPYIIYIPDINDKDNKLIYNKNYYELIESMKNGTFEFENKFFDVNSTINKIIYYIENKFELDSKLKKFYDYLNIKQSNDNTDKFIRYLNLSI